MPERRRRLQIAGADDDLADRVRRRPPQVGVRLDAAVPTGQPGTHQTRQLGRMELTAHFARQRRPDLDDAVQRAVRAGGVQGQALEVDRRGGRVAARGRRQRDASVRRVRVERARIQIFGLRGRVPAEGSTARHGRVRVDEQPAACRRRDELGIDRFAWAVDAQRGFQRALPIRDEARAQVAEGRRARLPSRAAGDLEPAMERRTIAARLDEELRAHRQRFNRELPIAIARGHRLLWGRWRRLRLLQREEVEPPVAQPAGVHRRALDLQRANAQAPRQQSHEIVLDADCVDGDGQLLLAIVDADPAQRDVPREIAFERADRQSPRHLLLRLADGGRQEDASPRLRARPQDQGGGGDQEQQDRRQRNPGEHARDPPHHPPHQKASPSDRWKAKRCPGSGLGVPSASKGASRFSRTPRSARMLPMIVR